MRHANLYELQIQREAEALHDVGFDVEVVCMRRAGGPQRQVVNGIEVVYLAGSRRRSNKLLYVADYASFFLRVAAHLAVRHIRRPFAVVQVNTMPDFLVFAAVVPKLLGSRVVAYMHEPSPELAETLFGRGMTTRVLRVVEQQVLRFADHAIAVTEQLKERFVERGADPDRISVVLNGADPESMLRGWSPPDESSLNGRFTVICHGAMEDRYGQDTIIEAAVMLRDELPTLEVVLAGYGSLLDEIPRTIEAQGLEDLIRFEGYVPLERLFDLLHSADVGVVAQKASPYSHLVHTNKMIDYWIFGLPVIASRLRAVSEQYGEHTLEFFEPGDARDLARAIRRLHDDTERRRELAQNGRLAQEQLGWAVQKRTYVEVFKRMLATSQGRPEPDPAETTQPSTRVSPRLQHLLRPQPSVELDARGGDGPPTWLSVDAWTLLARPRLGQEPAGELIEEFSLPAGERIRAVRKEDGSVYVPFDLEEAYRNYVTEAWRGSTRVRALSNRQLGLYYRMKRLLPRSFWLQARRMFIRTGRLPAFPRWPLETGVDRLLRFAAMCHLVAADRESGEFTWFWPDGHRAALVLSHDVESAAGLRFAPELADLEEERGLRSAFNIVASDYEIDMGIVRDLRDRGFEIGVHGVHHDRSLFSSRAEFERQVPQLAQAASRLGAVGFRSPAIYRVMDWLPELPFEYDCTVPHSDPWEPQPGGCCTLWPYLLGDVVELPYTLPQDHTLLNLLRKRSAQLWLDQVEAIEQRFGLVQCLSHPDPGYLGDRENLAVYVELLDAISGRDGLWRALPREVAEWWRRRESGELDRRETGTMTRAPAPDYARFEPPAHSSADAEASA